MADTAIFILGALLAVIRFILEVLFFLFLNIYGLIMVFCRSIYHVILITSAADGEPPSKEKLIRNPPPEATTVRTAGFEDFEDYEYTPIGHRHIRLLRVHAPSKGQGNTHPISCDLQTIDLDTWVASYMYNVMSYTWDGQRPDRYILIAGKRLKVTKNCEAMILQLRPSVLGVVLWIDAICINQQSVEEKSQQVPLMCDVYSGAKEVIIWLGEPAGEGGLVFNYIWLLWCFFYLPEGLRYRAERRMFWYMMKHNHAYLLQDLTHRSWFQRVWTIQEAILGPPAGAFAIRSTTVLCGGRSIPFDLFASGLQTLCAFSAITEKYPLNHLVWSHYLLAHHQPRLIDRGEINRMLYLMMERIRACGATEPRDRIYGVYGILTNCGLNLPAPDYRKDVSEIYWTFFVTTSIQTQSLQLLQLVSPATQPPFANTPSWVPNFTDPWRVGDVIGKARATSNSPAAFAFSSDRKILFVQGKIIDTISHVSSQTTWCPPNSGAQIQDDELLTLLPSHGYRQTISALHDWVHVALEHGSLNRYGENEDFMYAFSDALLGGVYLCSPNPRGEDMEDKRAFFEWFGVVSGMLPEKDKRRNLEEAMQDPVIRETFYEDPAMRDLVEDEHWRDLMALKTHYITQRYHHAVYLSTLQKSLFTTRRGYIGMGTRSSTSPPPPLQPSTTFFNPTPTPTPTPTPNPPPSSVSTSTSASPSTNPTSNPSPSPQEGDIIALLSGLHKPMILRPIPPPTDADPRLDGYLKFKIIGPAYISGIMAGELWDTPIDGDGDGGGREMIWLV